LIDTLLSFGTGLHETTQIVSQFIEDYQGRFESFLDIGTGTGVLALVALKRGAKSVVAFDIGDLSVEAAKHNFRVNGARGIIQKQDIRKYKDKKTYDFVAANLVTQDLIENMYNITKLVTPGGWLAVSGISLDNLPKLQKAFKDLPLKRLQLKKGQKWSGLLYQKTMS
jgi:ribosomal protein L11 methyltransferase